jgi:hypothetical protein
MRITSPGPSRSPMPGGSAASGFAGSNRGPAITEIDSSHLRGGRRLIPVPAPSDLGGLRLPHTWESDGNVPGIPWERGNRTGFPGVGAGPGNSEPAYPLDPCFSHDHVFAVLLRHSPLKSARRLTTCSPPVRAVAAGAEQQRPTRPPIPCIHLWGLPPARATPGRGAFPRHVLALRHRALRPPRRGLFLSRFFTTAGMGEDIEIKHGDPDLTGSPAGGSRSGGLSWPFRSATGPAGLPADRVGGQGDDHDPTPRDGEGRTGERVPGDGAPLDADDSR